MNYKNQKFGDWGLGIGNWGLGIGPNPQSPIPNPQSPIPNFYCLNFYYNIFIFIKIHIRIKTELNSKFKIYINNNLL